VVVSNFFADIFKNNAMNNFVLPVVVSDLFLAEIFESVDQNPEITLTIDLENQRITNNATGNSEHFAINAYKKECFLNGFDDIDYLLSKKDTIVEYENRDIRYHFA
jgi:3-isopropylmalate/(R)-2-methylmalate dehydratase small subunit